MSKCPPNGRLMRDVYTQPLSRKGRETLHRAVAFLTGVQRAPYQVSVLLAGYSPGEHRQGVFRASLVSGERTFGEWRMWRSLRPPREPDLPDLVDSLVTFAEHWHSFAVEAISRVPDPQDRQEVKDYLMHERSRYTTRTWRATALAQRVRAMAKFGKVYAPVWQAVEEAGFLAAVKRFDSELRTVRRHIENAPLDAAELEDLHIQRESSAIGLQGWLDEQASLLASFDAGELNALGLGDREPPDPPDCRISRLSRFEIAAKA